MKRIIAGLLSLVLLLTSFTGVAVAEVKLPYEYAPVTFFLNGQDLEDQFRQWAYETVTMYQNEYIRRTPYRYYDEYEHFSDYKRMFDYVLGIRKSNVTGNTTGEIKYAEPNLTEEQDKELIIGAIIGSLKERKEKDPNYIEKYYALSAKQRRHYTLQPNGEWKEDTVLKETGKQSGKEVWEQLANTATDTLNVVINTANELVKLDLPPVGTDYDFVKILTDYATDEIKEITKLCIESGKTACENEIKKYMAEEIAAVSLEAKAADMACIKEIYLNHEGENEKVTEAAKAIYDYYNDEKSDKDILNQIDVTDADVQDVLNRFEIQLERTIDTEDIVVKFIADTVKKAIGELFDNVDKAIEIAKENKIEIKEKKPLVLFPYKYPDEDEYSKFEKNTYEAVKEFLKNASGVLIDDAYTKWQKNKDIDFASRIGANVELDNNAENELSVILKPLEKIDFTKYILSFGNELNISEIKKRNPKTTAELIDKVICIIMYYAIDTYGKDAFQKVIAAYINSNEKEKELEKINKEIGGAICKSIGKIIGDVSTTIIQYNDGQILKMLFEEGVMHQGELWISMQTEGIMEKIIGQIPAVGAIVVASKVSDRAVTVGEDITKLAIAIHSWVSGEDEMSYLAQKVVYASSISEPRHQKVNESYPPDFLKKASIQEIWEVVSNMRMGANYDLQAAEAYNTVSLHIYESKSGTNFAKFLRGELHMFNMFASISNQKDWKDKLAAVFGVERVTDEIYQNVTGWYGVLNAYEAKEFVDEIYNMQRKINEGWNDEWLKLPGIDETTIISGQ